MTAEATRYDVRTFDDLCKADLEQVYLHGKEQMLRGRAFRILLDHANTVPQLEQLAFDGERGLDGWTTEELLEISNRFRLLSSPENEIRLYRQCTDDAFRASARVREFYILALNRVGRPAEAIEAALEISASGSRNALIWGMLGDSYTARMAFAEKLIDARDPQLIEMLPRYFPDASASAITVDALTSLWRDNLAQAERIYQQGFRESGSSFCGLGWMLRTIDQLADEARASTTTKRPIDDQLLNVQAELVAAALEMEGGSESLDYWTHAGRVELAVMCGESAHTLQACLARAIATADAAFKLSIIIDVLIRLREQFTWIKRAAVHDTARWDARLALVETTITALTDARTAFGHTPPTPPTHSATAPLDWLLTKTINFRALMGNLVPLVIEGTIGRVGARVPDLMINRRVRDDLLDLLEDKVLRALPAADRDDPLAVIARIHEVVGHGLRLAELQDLQSPAHAAFDARSDGLIALSGVDLDMRKDTRTSTDLTETLLMQTGDCRETMYLNGALFACWQQIQVRRHIATVIVCLELGYWPGIERIIGEGLPSILRYQLRGGQAAIFVESMAMESKYRCRQTADGAACYRPYGLAELRAGEPLTRYELENAHIEVTYADGSVLWLEPKDPSTGKWQPIACGVQAGVPLIPNAGADFANVRSIKLLNLVEDHAMTFLYDAALGKLTLCDGFYNELLFDSPYPFSFQPIDLKSIHADQPIRVAERTLVADDGSSRACAVHLNFLRFSRTDYATGLSEGDLPGKLQLMGRTFDADFKLECRRLDAGTSPLPTLLARVQHWLVEHNTAAADERAILNRLLSRLMLDLAKSHPDLVKLKYATADEMLIREACENDHVYLVLSGQLDIYKGGHPLLGKAGAPQAVTTGGIVGEISALSGGLATASVQGKAVVLSISKHVIQQQLGEQAVFRQSMQALAQSRLG